MIVYITVTRPQGVNRCICSDCYLCKQGGCTKFPQGEVRISAPDMEGLLQAWREGIAIVRKIVMTKAEKEILSAVARGDGERGTICRL